MAATTLLAKTSCPRLSRVVLRPRLFEKLDQGPRIVFVQGPPGAGKTVLAASWARSRRRQTHWLQLDPADAEVATFFHYLGAAALSAQPSVRLPSFTPEWIPTPSAFAKVFFRSLAGSVPSNLTIVLDDFHELPSESLVHTALVDGISELPSDALVLVVSRAAPPPAFAHLRARGEMDVVDSEQLVLTREEAQALAELRRGARPRASPDALWAAAAGWAAGFVLLLEAGTETPAESKIAPSVFDYFAAQVLSRADRDTRDVLLAAALLHEVPADVVAQLTGIDRALVLIEELSRRGYFVARHGDSATYRFHPLFHQFLRATAERELPPARLRDLRLHAARLLDQRGERGEAFSLACATDAFEEAGRILLADAPTLQRQGRVAALALGLRRLPRSVTDANGWFAYWAGVAAFPTDPSSASAAFATAFERFVAAGDDAGIAIAWATAINVHIWGLESMVPLDAWIDRLAEIESCFGSRPAQVDALVAGAALGAIVYRRPQHPARRLWEQRTLEFALSIGDPRLRLNVGQQLLMHDGWWFADLARARVVLDALSPIARSAELDPVSAILWDIGESLYRLHLADAPGCAAATARGRANANSNGYHLWDPVLIAVQAAEALMREDLRAARIHAAELASAVQNAPTGSRGMSHFVSGLVALRSGDAALAREQSRVAARMADETGWPLANSMSRLTWALAVQRGGGDDPCLEDELRRCEALGYAYGEYACRVGLAAAALRRHDVEVSLHHLRSGLALGRNCGLMNLTWFGGADLSDLCALALENGIEPEYVRALVLARGVPAPERARSLEIWPWRAKVEALDGIRVLTSDSGRAKPRKAQKKPLDLLAILVDAGPRGVDQTALADALWPDADGDHALHALETATYRLRRLLGDREALVQRDGRLAIDPRRLFVDVWALEELLGRAADLPATRLRARIEALWGPASRGSTPGSSPRRERLRGRVESLLQHHGSN